MSATGELTQFLWPVRKLGEAMRLVAARAGFSPRPVDLSAGPPLQLWEDVDALGRWLSAAAAQMGVEAEQAEAPLNDLDQVISRSGPALVQIPGGIEPRFLAVLAKGRRK